MEMPSNLSFASGDNFWNDRDLWRSSTTIIIFDEEENKQYSFGGFRFFFGD